MRLAPLVAAVAASLALPQLAHAGSGGFVPPMRIDVGPAVSGQAPDPSFQIVAGLHWASIYPKPRAGIDVGFGLVATTHGSDDTTVMVPSNGRAIAVKPPSELTVFGGYAEVAMRTAGNGWWRTWVGTRIESGRATIDGDRHGYVGVATRISTEAYVAGAAAQNRALFVGVLAIGLYGELSARQIVGVGDDFGASVGLSFRLPLLVAD